MLRRPHLLGYASHLSARPGQRVTFHVSSEAPEVGYEVVRLPGGAPAGPSGRVPGLRHRSFPGSYLRVAGTWPATPSWTLRCFVHPTRPGTGRAQGILAACGGRLFLDGAGHLVLEAGRPAIRLRSPSPLHERTWCFVAGTYDAGTRRLRLLAAETAMWRWIADETATTAGGGSRGPALVGAMGEAGDGDARHGVGTFDGKVASPCVDFGALGVEELRAAAAGDPPRGDVAWSLAEATGESVPDRGPHALHAQLVNAPALAVTGPRWSGRELDPGCSPREYDAVHLHRDDLDDARWPEAFAWQLADDLPSGVYAARLRAGAAEDCVPVVVSAARRRGARVGVLLPTFTYLAYGNNANDPCGQGPRVREVPRAHDFSLYERHADGAERCHAPVRRPLAELRPTHRYPGLEAPVHLPGDLRLLEWLEHRRVVHDVISDHALHADGRELLAGYDVLLTGGHPEYVSGAILDALEAFVAGGGRLMYLGGNGFYWVTAPTGPDLQGVEVRRGHCGTRPWHSEPGEAHLAATGEPGGLWRHRGRPPNRLTGVGFAAYGCDRIARGYRRTPAGLAPRSSFVFRGVDPEETIGAFGPCVTGAAGIEVDRADPALGTPRDAVVLATARIASPRYFVAIEDLEAIDGCTSGERNHNVRADMTLRVLAGGGAVFSVGSIAWSSCLPHDGYDNSVERVTWNVLRAFLEDELEPTTIG